MCNHENGGEGLRFTASELSSQPPEKKCNVVFGVLHNSVESRCKCIHGAELCLMLPCHARRGCGF